MTREARDYFPNDILLTWFNEGYQSQYLKDYRRPERKKLQSISAHAPTHCRSSDTQRAVDQELHPRRARLNAVATLDTRSISITDSAVYGMDSMLVAMRYLRTDTASRALYGHRYTAVQLQKTPKRARVS